MSLPKEDPNDKNPKIRVCECGAEVHVIMPRCIKCGKLSPKKQKEEDDRKRAEEERKLAEKKQAEEEGRLEKEREAEEFPEQEESLEDVPDETEAEVSTSEKAYQGPVPVPDRVEEPIAEKILTEEVEMLIQKVKFLNLESERLHSEMRKVEGKREVFGAEISHVVASRLKNKFAILKILGVWMILMSCFAAYLFMSIDRNIEKKIAYDLSEKFSEISQNKVFDEIIQASSTAMMKRNVHPQIKEFKETVREHRDYMETTKEEMIAEKKRLIKEIDFQNRLNDLSQTVTMAVRGSRADYLKLMALHDQTPDEGLKEIVKHRISYIYEYYDQNDPASPKDAFTLNDIAGEDANPERIEKALRGILKSDQDWRNRRRAAKFMGALQVSNLLLEALVDSARFDPHLEVVEQSLLSFRNLTGQKLRHPFDLKATRNWVPSVEE